MTTSSRRLIAAPFVLALTFITSPSASRAAPGLPGTPVIISCPDGFTGPCCGNATPNLPPLPAVQWQDAKQSCWIDCGPQASSFGSLSLAAPTPSGACGVFDTTLTGSLIACPAPLGSRLRLYYTRHWTQAFPVVGNVEVYRFVAVGNVCVMPTAAWTCQIEMAPSTPFVFGFVDYAFRKTGPPPCNLIFRAAALALGHPCDRFVHDGSCPFVADPRPPTHPLDQYVLVAPGANFTFSGTLVPPQGAGLNTTNEGLRLIQPNSTGTCTPTEVFSSLQLTNVLQQCACVSATATGGPFWRQSLRSTTTCSSTLDTSPICPFNFSPPPMTTPFPTLVAWSIGAWTPGQFPGLVGGNRFFLAQGSGTYQRPGNAVCPPLPAQREVYYGVENQWGTLLMKGGKRVDLVDNVQPIVGTSSVMPVVGGPAPLGTQVVFFY